MSADTSRAHSSGKGGRRPSNAHRPGVSRASSTGLRFGMFAVCVTRDSDPGLNSGKAKPLYHLLISYSDVSGRDTAQGYPYRAALASALDCSKQTIDRATDYLEHQVGLVSVERRKVEGKEDENDANLYRLHDAWLIHGMYPPADTPPQLVARYGHHVQDLDVAEWVEEHAPGFDLAGWQAEHEEILRAQEAKREEQRRKEKARKAKAKKKKQGQEKEGGVTHDATPQIAAEEGGDVTHDALSRAFSPEPSSRDKTGGPAGGQSAEGFTRAGTREGAAPKTKATTDGSAVDSNKPSTQKKPQRKKPQPIKTSPLRPVAGEEEVWQCLAPVLRDLGIDEGKQTPTLRKAVRLFLGHDTDARGGTAFARYRRRPEHALARINYGWYRAGGPERSAAEYEGLDPIKRPIGYLATILTNQDCVRPECELGRLLTTGEDCRECEAVEAERAADALAAQLQEHEKQQQAAGVEPTSAVRGASGDGCIARRGRWTCEGRGCGRVGWGQAPDPQLCSECLEDIEQLLQEGASAPF